MELREELWIARLGKETELALESSTALWQSLCTQIEQRLLSGEQIRLEPLGILSLEQQSEYVARLPEAKDFLVPPRLVLEVLPGSQVDSSKRITTLTALQPALTLATSIRPEAVGRYLEAIAPLIEEYIARGESLSLPGLGFLSIGAEGEHAQRTISLHVAEGMAATLNRPFAMFVPVEVSDMASQGDIELRELAILPDSEGGYWVNIPYREASIASHVQEADAAQTALAESAIREVVPPVSEPTGQMSQEPQVSATQLEPEYTEQQSKQPERVLPKLGRWGWILAVCLVLGILLAVYYRYGIRKEDVQTDALWQISTTQQSPSLPKTQDSIPSLSKTLQQEVEQTGSASTIESGLLLATEAASERIDTITLHKGDRLTRIAKEKYGHKVFWVYIYKHNRDIIKNPNNIPIGTQLILPPASLYGIDPRDTNSRARALGLENDIWLHKGQIQ